jgi:hypothetical protein
MATALALAAILLLATFPGWHKETDPDTGSEMDVKPFPSRPLSQIAVACASAATILLLIASLWQHVGAVGAAAIAEGIGYGNIQTRIGTASMAMAWLAFALTFTAALGLVVMILSIMVLDRLTDDE